MTMEIIEITQGKKKYLPLLLLGDEQESMIDRYLEKGTMFLLRDREPVAICVVTAEPGGILEVKNLAVGEAYQRKGYGRAMLEFLAEKYGGKYAALRVGTGESPLTLPFYESCGFSPVGRIPNFFLENYDYPIWEAGIMLRDMILLERKL